METFGKVLRKSGAVDSATGQSVHKTTQYEKLSQEPSDEEVDDDVVFLQESAVLHRNGFAAADIRNHIQPADEAVLAGLLQKGSVSSKKANGTDYVEVKTAKLRCCRRLLSRRKVCVILFLVLIFLATALITLLVSTFQIRHVGRLSQDWSRTFNDYATESCVRLVDVDEDGRLDVIFSLARLLNTTVDEMFDRNASRQAMEELCQKRGELYPCMGELVALRGNDSKILWSLRTHAWMFELNCGTVDINKDGKPDCIGTGRFSAALAFDPRTGKPIWQAQSDHFFPVWSSFGAVALPDFTNDGIPELLVAHSSDPRFPPEELNRYAGRFIMLNGATGRSMGRYLDMPGNLETYMYPVIHTLADGSQYLIFGHGGETVPGSLLTISVPDLYRYLMQIGETDVVPHTTGKYNQWGFLTVVTENKFIREIYRSKSSGLMVPPVCVDINRDGINDLFIVSFDGNCTLFDGQRLSVIWTRSFSSMQSYSSPAPGYFNDDDVIDFMVHLNYGVYPEYNYSMVVVLDGKTGIVLWSLNTTMYGMTSDLVAQTTQPFHDVFILRVKGHILSMPKQQPSVQLRRKRNRVYEKNPSVYDKLRDTTLRPQHLSPSYWRRYRNDDAMPLYRVNGMGSAGLMRSKSRYGSYDYIPPDGRQSFQDDDMSERLFEYGDAQQQSSDGIGEGDEQSQDEPDVSQQFRGQGFVQENRIGFKPTTYRTPTSSVVVSDRRRRKRHEEQPTKSRKTHISDERGCLLLNSNERTTGALGDVDGDGTLDLVTIITMSAVVTDQFGNYVRSEKLTRIAKYNLELDMTRAKEHNFVKLQTSSSPVDSFNSKMFGQLRPWTHQPWAAYLGSDGTSIYSNRH